MATRIGYNFYWHHHVYKFGDRTSRSNGKISCLILRRQAAYIFVVFLRLFKQFPLRKIYLLYGNDRFLPNNLLTRTPYIPSNCLYR
jgi:hypothetical protein